MTGELDLRLRAERLIRGFEAFGSEGAIEALADIETAAEVLALAGELPPTLATSIVADTVDALVVRGAPWVEARAVDLDVRRLYDLVAGAPRPRLQRVVAVTATTSEGTMTSADVWDDRIEAHVVDGSGAVRPSLVVEPRGSLGFELDGGRVASDAGRSTQVDRAELVARLAAHALAVARHDGSISSWNRARRRLVVAEEVLGVGDLVRRFDADAADGPTAPDDTPTLLAVVPIAARTPYGWLLSVERWGDHWRAHVVDVGGGGGGGGGRWSALDAGGRRYGGVPMGDGVVRFSPALEVERVTLQRLGPDGSSIDVDVVVA